ncbi:MAG: hypothetical protein KDD51_05585 [Bdellovibrionales bacterium]|nr:hypothetical protein [Bdellovibrionales bacterium]
MAPLNLIKIPIYADTFDMKSFSLFVVALSLGSPFASQAQAKSLVFFVPGGASPVLTTMHRLMRQFENAGWPAANLSQHFYPYKGSLKRSCRVLRKSMDAEVERHPGGTPIVVVAHSLGQFIAMYCLAEAPWQNQIQRFIGLAGVANGQDSKPFGCGVKKCGEWVQFLTPYRNPNLVAWLQKVGPVIQTWAPCSLYSPIDRFVDSPFDSGALPYGDNYTISDFSHLDFITREDAYSTMAGACGLDFQ